jgi:hypothetical protein
VRQPSRTGWAARRGNVAPTRRSTRRTHRSSSDWASTKPTTSAVNTSSNQRRYPDPDPSFMPLV